MSRGKKLVVVLSVLITGISTALFFRKDASQNQTRHEASQNPTFYERVERRVASGAAWAKGSATTVPASKPTARGLSLPTAAISKSSGEPTHHPPTVQRNFNPVGALLEPIEGTDAEQPDTDSAEDGELSADDAGLSGMHERTHRIVDGDTLSRLAELYLGHADRYMEIFALNRALLRSPDLLPIGAVIKLPPRERAAAAPNLQPDEAMPPELSQESPLELVPVPGDE